MFVQSMVGDKLLHDHYRCQRAGRARAAALKCSTGAQRPCGQPNGNNSPLAWPVPQSAQRQCLLDYLTGRPWCPGGGRKRGVLLILKHLLRFRVLALSCGTSAHYVGFASNASCMSLRG